MTADPITTNESGAANRPYREVTDAHGRVYRVGETDRDILGHSRKIMIYLPWIAMMAISVFEYAYGSAEDTLSSAHGWTQSNTFWILSVWVFFQAGIAFPAGWMREKGILTARKAMYVGSVLCVLGFLALSHLDNVWLAIIGFGVIGGVGAGLVYATCINMVGKWFPERRGARTGFVNGGFAYGSLPFIFIFNYAFDTGNYHRVLDLIGCYILIVVFGCAFFFKDPPKNWWPADIDPLTYGGNDKTATSLVKNPPAVKQFTPKEAIRTGMLPLMWLSIVLTAGVSIFGISFQVDFAKDVGFGPLVAASSMGIMAVINGIGRAVVGWLSDLWGRKLTLVFVILVLGLAQFGVIWAGPSAQRVAVPVLRLPLRFRRRRLLPDVRRPDPGLLRRELQRHQLRPGVQRKARQRPLRRRPRLDGGGGLGLQRRVRAGRSGVSMVAAAIALLLRQPGRSDRELPQVPQPQPAA